MDPNMESEAVDSANEDEGYRPRWPYEVKQLAYKLDPECWASYSGKPRKFKAYMDARRTASLEEAERKIERGNFSAPPEDA